MDESYPLTYSVDYPDRELNRLTTFFRVFMVIPIAIVLGHRRPLPVRRLGRSGDDATSAAGGFLFFGPLLMILFVGRSTRAGGSTGTASCCGS